MPSLRQLLLRHPPILLLDAAGARVHAGWLASERLESAQWASAEGEAGTALFAALSALGAAPGAAAAFALCEAPGSVLGIRTAAMAIRCWRALRFRPVFAYNALAVMAEGTADPDPNLAWIADARRDTWHFLRRGGELRRVGTCELGDGPLATAAEFRHWAALPGKVRQVPYDLPRLLRQAPEADLFHASDEPDAFLHAQPAYATWDGKVHAAP
ncbi:MAG: peptidase M22 [Opitutaceae bacterium]